MNLGHSWSGRERNNCFLNMGDGSFVDFSYTSGLDLIDDGRAVAVVDQDRDGDLDLWLRNRTGPQLRLMVNQSPPSRRVELRLVGTTSNRDAIGASVRLDLGERTQRRDVFAGDGYLSQSSRWLHFGLGKTARPVGLEVRWPGGTAETFPAPEPDRRYLVRQGSGRLEAIESKPVALSAGVLGAPPLPVPTRVLLKSPLPLPPSLRRAIGLGDRPAEGPLLVNLWAHWCAPCVEELRGLARAHAELREHGLGVVALNVDIVDDRARARELFEERIATVISGPELAPEFADPSLGPTIEALLSHVLHRFDGLKLPTSLLVDARGMLQQVYIGPVAPEMLLADLDRISGGDMPASRRSLLPGRWYFRSPRNLPGLAADLEARGRSDDAAFYEAIDRMRQRRGGAR